jgi:hypothetical protein
MTSIVSGAAPAGPSRPWPAHQVEQWPIEGPDQWAPVIRSAITVSDRYL